MVRLVVSLLAMPGIVFHEFGHLVFCKLVGARVHKVVFFQFADPAGYVMHTAPTRFVDLLAIVAGPLVVNSAVAFALFKVASYTWVPLPFDNLDNLGRLLPPLVALWWGIAISLQAFPSKGDAKSLWKMTNVHVRKANLLAVVGYPIVAAIYAVNLLKFVHVDFAYALALLVAAVAL